MILMQSQSQSRDVTCFSVRAWIPPLSVIIYYSEVYLVSLTRYCHTPALSASTKIHGTLLFQCIWPILFLLNNQDKFTYELGLAPRAEVTSIFSDQRSFMSVFSDKLMCCEYLVCMLC